MDFSWEITFKLATFGTPVLNAKATQIYLIVLPIFFSIGAVGWRQKKKKIR